MPTPDEGFQIAEKRIADAKRKRAPELSLSGLGLSVLPESIDQLTGLQTLDLSSNQLTALPESIDQLTGLQTLQLSGNQLTALPESIGQLTGLQILNLYGNQLVALPESIGQLAGLQTLNLSFNQLAALPEPIGQLTGLQTLFLYDNRLAALPESIGQLTGLQTLALYGNRLVALPESIGRLADLLALALYGNRLVSLPESIGRLAGLQALFLHDNQLAALPESIGQLAGLQTLQLSGNRLATLPESIGQLASLQTLDLSFNQLAALPESIGQLASLQTLTLYNNQLAALPESIGQLAGLQTLHLSGNQLTALPESIDQLTGLQTLQLSGNQLTALPESIGQLTGLQILNLYGNQLVALPESIGQLAGLQTLILSGNQLATLPDSIHRLRSLRAIYLHDNPALKLPPEILGPTYLEVLSSPEKPKPAEPRTILVYYAQSRTSQNRILGEAKLLLVGQGGVGKTSLVRYLVENESRAKDEPPTEGIRRTPWPRLIKPPYKRDPQPVTLNVWDFGGQEIMHATHQFFLTKRSLYLLVLDARTTEAENNLYYWLKVIQSFGSDAPVLVVVNKAEGGVSLDLNESRLIKDFAPNLKGFVRVSCQSGKGIPTLRKKIDEQVRQLGHVFDRLPAAYFRVKEKIGGWAEKRNFISYAEYDGLCAEADVTDGPSRHQLLRLLHDLGLALNFDDPDDPYELHDTNVLDPEWVTDAVYRVITSTALKDARGVLRRDQLADLLKDNRRFPPAQHEFIIDLMRKFELCFDFPDSSGDRFLVPERLAKDEPDVGWDEGDPLRFQVKYNVLPPGLVCRFIVKMHTHLKPDTPTYWRDGAVLYIYGNRCLVRGSVEDRQVYIAIQGAEETRRQALSLIREKLAEIHRTIKGLEVTELVPVPGQPGVVVDYKTLAKRVEKNIDRFLPEGGEEPVSAVELLHLVDVVHRERPLVLKVLAGASAGALMAHLVPSNYILSNNHVMAGHDMESDRSLPKPVDFGIITMKEEEFTAVEKRFEPVRLVHGDSRRYLHSQITTRDGRPQDVLIARCVEQGQTEAMQCAHDLIQDANPRWIFVVGIAGAFPAEEYTLGDVLLANRVYDFAVTAALEGNVVEQSPGGGGVHPAVKDLLGMIPGKTCRDLLGEWNGSAMIAMPKPELKIPNNFKSGAFYGKDEWRKKVRDRLKLHFPADKPPRPPLYRVGAVAAGNTLVKDTSLATAWKAAARTVSHIEMELGGVYAAVQGGHTPLLSIRGISDVVGFNRSSAWTDYACQTAAAFARALIGSGLIDTRKGQPAG